MLGLDPIKLIARKLMETYEKKGLITKLFKCKEVLWWWLILERFLNDL